MDHIYPTKDYNEYVIKDHVEELKNLLRNSEMPQYFDDISQCLKISEDELRKKSLEICAIHEDYGNEPASRNNSETIFDDFPQEALELNCIKFLQKGNINFKDDRCKDSRLLPKTAVNTNNDNADIAPHSDSIITIRFYEPFKYTPCVKNHPKFQFEYKVLGSNFLTELRDIFYCQCNFGPFYDISDDPTNIPAPNESRPNPGFYFIHDTFYNDTRNPENDDYSKVITTWYQKFNYVRDFKTALMQETKFEDLRIRLGYPSVYQHHGACEHLFCITSVDLIDSSDSLLRSDYPKLAHSSNKRSVFCEICNQREASYLVTNCPLHVKDPIKLCENCFFSFHYINKQTKTCHFNAYRIYSVNPVQLNGTSDQSEATM